jgi:site-specific DNA-methyltransferase (adenine-specific)
VDKADIKANPIRHKNQQEVEMEDRFQAMLGDCLGVMDSIADGMVDAIICDLPYGITSCKWDSVIPLDELWAQYERVTKPTAAIILTASQPFTSALLMSKPEWFRHEWIWIKNRGSNFANTVREPRKEHESVLVFCRKTPWTYNKQMQERTGSGGDRVKYGVAFQSKSENYREFEGRPHAMLPELRVPSSWQKFNTEVGLHPTQKPVPLMEYLVRTYTDENEIVLDNAMGSGTTGVACLNLNRKFIGIESDLKYFQVAKERLEKRYSEGIPRPGFRKEIIHGSTCPKAPHTRSGYLHGEDDDTPYSVDGLSYCGRCHTSL